MYRIVITASEQASIKQMESKVEELTGALKEIANQQSQLSEDAQKKEAEIESTFNAFRNSLSEREKALKAKLSAETKKLGDDLKVKQEALKKHLETSSAALDKENALILDPSMDAKVK